MVIDKKIHASFTEYHYQKYKFAPWLKIHRALALVLVLTIITHIVLA
jgi:hypothetical protein